MSAFAAAVGALFADPNIGRDAVYIVDGGVPVPRDGTMFFSGTIPFSAEVTPGARTFSAALLDPVLRRALRHDFTISVVTSKVAA